MTQRWLDLTYVHWRVEPGAVADRIPDGLTPDLFDGSAWVGLVPFQMADIAVPPFRPVPYFGTFPETNVRTYVTGPAGPGVWFDSLDVTRLAPVLVARSTYRLPYIWSEMSIDKPAGYVEYRCRRRWPRGAGARSHVAIRPGSRLDPSPLDHFLTSRWGLYTTWLGRLAYAPVTHEAWPLRSVTEIQVEDELVAAAGYDPSGGVEHVAYSPGVAVRIGRPRFV
jgi:uncharacterized protein YqjF (DUF2071 family)